MEASIRKATLQDIEGIVKIHQEAFKDFFLTSLGESFLKLYYGTFVNSNDGVVYCAVKDKTIVGFSATSYVSHGFNSKLIKHNLFKYGCVALKLLLSQPKAVLRLMRNLEKENKDTTIKDDGLYAELYSIAVGPNCQGEGIGRFLLTVTEADVKEHNSEISLTTDYYDNDKTVAFYRALGYKELYDFITYPDRRMWRLIKELK
jgi:ribosomal protein S18 acetylase RimI-like enzyme